MIMQEKQCPDWFDLKNYSTLPQLKCFDFLIQLEIRIGALKYAKHCNTLTTKEEQEKFDNQSWLWDNYNNWLSLVPEGEVVFTYEQELDENGNPQQNFTLPFTRRVKPLNFHSLNRYYFDAVKKGFIEENGYVHANYFESSVSIHNQIDTKSNEYTKYCFGNGKILSEIDIANYRDEEILRHIEKMLPLWRKQLGIIIPPAPKRKPNTSKIRKLLDYKTIQLLDLLIWEQISHMKISGEYLSQLLFPPHLEENVLDGKQVNETIRTFAESFVENENQFRYFWELIEREKHQDKTIHELAYL